MMVNLIMLFILIDIPPCFKLKNKNITDELWNEKNLKGRWREYSIQELKLSDNTNLDITWLKDDNLIDLENLSKPEILLDEILEDIESSLNDLKIIRDNLN